MQWFILGIILLGLAILLGYAFINANPQRLARLVRQLGGWGLIGAGVGLSLFGRLIIGAPLVLIGLGLLGRRLPLGGLGGLGGFGGRRTAGQTSRVRTATVEMTLDHDTGEIDGSVLTGRFAGRALSELALEELLDLRGDCLARDAKAAQLVEAYLDRERKEWREAAGAGAQGSGEGANAGPGGPMSREEAYEILGLGPGSGPEDVRQAHRQLMKKLHPDLGGSTYLAAKVNQAKDLLLGRS
jgi:hypothetical protein